MGSSQRRIGLVDQARMCGIGAAVAQRALTPHTSCRHRSKERAMSTHPTCFFPGLGAVYAADRLPISASATFYEGGAYFVTSEVESERSPGVFCAGRQLCRRDLRSENGDGRLRHTATSGAWPAHFQVVDVAIQGLRQSEDELRHATKSPPQALHRVARATVTRKRGWVQSARRFVRATITRGPPTTRLRRWWDQDIEPRFRPKLHSALAPGAIMPPTWRPSRYSDAGRQGTS